MEDQSETNMERSPLETDLESLVKKAADHSLIREVMERMATSGVPAKVSYTIQPACNS